MAPDLLFEKILTETAISTRKLKSHCRNLPKFFHSFPSQLKHSVCEFKFLHACVQTPSGSKIVVAELVTNDDQPINLCRLSGVEFCVHWGPVLQGGFRYQSGFNVKVEYFWVHGDLHLTIKQPQTLQIDLEAPAQQWRYLGMRELKKHDIRRKCFQINQTDLREFIASTSSQDLRDLLENYEPMMVTVHTLQGVEDGQIQTVSTRFHDWSSTAIKINCKKTMDKCRNLFEVNGIIFVLYRWIAGQLEIGIGLPGQELPD